ncbi:hypothetical protein LTR70_001804 [Exophiala xenobiotica]|nr:hypothetical protein LTR70_001804 [Exophiala xenobiotica]
MPDDVLQSPPRIGRLFSPLKFWVAHRIPDRSEVLKALTNHGGLVVQFEKDADYCLADPAAKLLPTGRTFYDYKYVDDSLNISQLQDPDDYRIQLPAAADRPVGSRTLAGKSTRTRFTPQDDQLLCNWIIPYRDNGGTWQGNEIYKQLERRYPHHPYQSWRSRFIDYVQHMRFNVTETVNPFEEIANAEAEQDRQRLPKRRRLNDPRSVDIETTAAGPAQVTQQAQTLEPTASAFARPPSLPRTPRQQQISPPPADGAELEDRARQLPSLRDVVNVVDLDSASAIESQTTVPNTENIELTPRDSRRQSLSVKAWRSMREVFPTLTWTEGDRLYKAVPYIYNSNPDNRKTCFQNMSQAGEWDKHSAEQWETYYHEAILPEYIRRNGIRDEEELEVFIADALAREEAQRGQTPEIKREPSPDPRDPVERQRDRELERARAETEDIAFSDTSSDSENQADAPAAYKEDSTVQRRSSPAVEPRAPAAQRAGVHANEGRKRASQQTNSTQSDSQPVQASQPPTVSPKKGLFGQTLSISQTATQAGTQTELTSTEVNTGTALHHSSVLGEANRAPVTSSLSSVPTAQKPPESYQLPPKSASTSQETAQDDTADNSAVTDAGLKTSVTSIGNQPEQRAPSAPSRASSPSIDLLGDGELDGDDDGRSQGALSDTGSEYMAFDTAPERSQLWETAADHADEEVDESVDEDEGGTTGESDQHEGDTAALGKKSMIPLPPTPIRPRVIFKDIEDDDEEITNEPDAYSMQHEEVVRSIITERIETQALFEQNENDASEFDLPPPEGGWEALGLADISEENPDEPVSSVELPDDHPLKQRVSPSPSPSQTTKSSTEPDNRNSSPVVVPQAQEVHELSSDETQAATDGEEEEAEVQVAPAPQIRETPRSAPGRSVSIASAITTSSHTTSSGEQSSGSPAFDNLPSLRILQDWVEAQRKRYEELPPRVFRRLASIAMQSTNENITSATILLRNMVAAYTASETTRRLEHNRLQNLKKPPQPKPKPFKLKTQLSDTEAKAFLPDDVMGVWTAGDDEAILSCTSASIRRVHKKHTKNGAKKRARFLRHRYGLSSWSEYERNTSDGEWNAGEVKPAL